MQIKIDLFTLETIKFIFSNFWIWFGTLILLIVINGDIRRVIASIRTFAARVRAAYAVKVERAKKIRELRK